MGLISRRALVSSIGVAGVGLLCPKVVKASANTVWYAESQMVHGQSTDGYYQFSGNTQLSVEKEVGSTLWTNFECNRICGEESILTIAWIQYGTEVVTTTRDLNKARTDRRYLTTVCEHTRNYGLGVIGYSQVFLNQVSGGYLEYETVWVNPARMGQTCKLYDITSMNRIPALGINGEHGEILMKDVLFPLELSSDDCENYFSENEGTVFLPLYEMGGNDVIGCYEVNNTVS